MGQRLLDALGALGRYGSSELGDIGVPSLLVVLGVSLGASLYISYLYVVFFKSRATGSEIHRAFPLVGVAVTAIFVSVQFSLPLSLGLLGALSIVRFRTPIKEPEEIGFILLVVATSFTAATFNMIFLSILLVVATVAILLMQLEAVLARERASSGTFICTMRTPESRAKLDELRVFLRKALPAGYIDSVSEVEDSTTLHYSFMKLSEGKLVELNEGVAAIAGGVESHVHFKRPGGV